MPTRSRPAPIRRATRLTFSTVVAALALSAGAAGTAGAQSTVSIVGTPNVVQMAVPVGGGDPPPQAVVLRGFAGNQPATHTGLAIQSVRYETLAGGFAASGWLTTSFDRTTTPAVMTVRAATGTLPAGSYRATVDVQTANGATGRVLVTFEVPRSQPTLALPQVDLAFAPGADAATATAAHAVVLASDLDRVPLTGLALGTPHYDIGTPGWLTATLDGTTSPATVRLVARRRLREASGGSPAQDLAPGYHRVQVPVIAPGASNSGRTILIGLTVPAATTPPAGTPRLMLQGGNESSGIGTSTTGFTTHAGQRDPSPQVLVVRNDQGGFMADVTVGAPAYAAGQPSGWLAVEQLGTTQGAAIVLRATVGALAPGLYTATVPVTAPGAQGSPGTITARFRVLDPRPQLSLVPNSTQPSDATVEFRGSRYGAEVDPTVVPVLNVAPAGTDQQIGNATLGAIAYGSTAGGWLSAELLDPRAPTSLVLRAQLGTLPTGVHTATVPVLADGVTGSPRTVRVTFVVGAPTGPALQLSSRAVTLDARGGQATVTQAVTVQNAGAGTLSGVAAGAPVYAEGQPGGWLAVVQDGTAAGATLTLTATPGELPAGTYQARVPVTAAAGTHESPQELAVTLLVPPRPRLALAATTVTLVADAGGAAVAQDVAVTNAGEGTLDGLSAGPAAHAAGEPTGWLTATLAGGTAPATLTLQATPGTLAPGRYTATVPVRATAAGLVGGPAQVTVTLEVRAPQAPPAQLALSRDTATITMLVHAPATRSTTLQVRSADGSGDAALGTLSLAPVTYEGTTSGWLGASLSASAAPATLTLRGLSRGLAAGVHAARVTVRASAGGERTAVVLLEVVDLKAAGTALVTPDALPAAERARLDRQGNADGQYNLGDFLALRTRLGLR